MNPTDPIPDPFNLLPPGLPPIAYTVVAYLGIAVMILGSAAAILTKTLPELEEMADRTETKWDNVVVRWIAKILRVIVVVLNYVAIFFPRLKFGKAVTLKSEEGKKKRAGESAIPPTILFPVVFAAIAVINTTAACGTLRETSVLEKHVAGVATAKEILEADAAALEAVARRRLEESGGSDAVIDALRPWEAAHNAAAAAVDAWLDAVEISYRNDAWGIARIAARRVVLLWEDLVRIAASAGAVLPELPDKILELAAPEEDDEDAQ